MHLVTRTYPSCELFLFYIHRHQHVQIAGPVVPVSEYMNRIDKAMNRYSGFHISNPYHILERFFFTAL